MLALLSPSWQYPRGYSSRGFLDRLVDVYDRRGLGRTHFPQGIQARWSFVQAKQSPGTHQKRL